MYNLKKYLSSSFNVDLSQQQYPSRHSIKNKEQNCPYEKSVVIYAQNNTSPQQMPRSVSTQGGFLACSGTLYNNPSVSNSSPYASRSNSTYKKLNI